MHTYSLSHLSDPELVRDLVSLIAKDRVTTATLLAHIAEFDARRLYLPAAFPSMFAYCVQELHLSEDGAYRRITAARVARQFPLIFELLAEGRLHLTGVGLLAPYLTRENAEGLLTAAERRTKSEIEELIARRFPRSEELGLVQVLPGSPCGQLVPERVETHETESPTACPGELVPERVETREGCPEPLAPERADPRSKIGPVAQDRFLIQLTVGRGTHDKLRHTQELLSHQIPSGDMAQVIDWALEAAIEKLERRKFAATARPRRARPSTNPRHIPAQVKRLVWERDQGQCTFVSESGHRCTARKFLEFDHSQEVARGGRATVSGIRLRCRAHNQYQAERTFGAEFMRCKREMAQRAAAARRHA